MKGDFSAAGSYKIEELENKIVKLEKEVEA
jgi:hypothetical protein